MVCKRICLLLALTGLLAGPALAGATTAAAAGEKIVTPPDTIVADGIPPIPERIQQSMAAYAELRSTAFLDWLPGDRGMLVTTRRGNTSQLYALAEPGGQLTQLTDYNEPVTAGAVCPNPEKNYLVFMKDVGGGENYQYYRQDLAGGEAVLITDGKSRHMGIHFNHAGDRIAFTSNARTGMFFDVYVMDPEKPDSRKLVFTAQKPAYYLPSGWSGDDKQLLVIEYLSANQVNTLQVNLADGKVTNVTPESKEPQFFAMGMMTTDGKYLFGITDRDSEFRKLVRYEPATGNITVITAGIDWDVDAVDATPDQTKCCFVTNEDGLNKVYLLDPDTLAYTPVPNVPAAVISGVSFDRAGRRMAMNINNARMNGDVYTLAPAGGEPVRWTRSETGGLDLDAFSLPELIHYPTFDQENGQPRKIPAFYYRPGDEKKAPFPVLIDIHGGPEGQFRPTFQSSTNYLINELGMAILAPNVRGSSGYGKSYLLMDNAEKREDSVKDIGALLDWIATRPELDASRVVVYGGSYGGYMVLSAMTHYSDRLAAGVDIVGISNFVTFLKNTSDYRRDLRRAEYGDEREIGEFLQRISPTTNAHKITKPLFVIQGKNDPRVPLSEAEQMVQTLRQNKVPVWYLMATNEGHGFRKKDNRDYMNYAVIRFLEEFVLKSE